MTTAEKLQKLKVFIPAEDDMDVLSTYLDLAAMYIIKKAYPFRDDVTEVPSQYDLLHLEIATYLYNKRGAEGETYHSENGINRSYENGAVPASMLKTVVPFAGVVSK